MASRQPSRPLRSSPPIISGDRLSGAPGPGQASERGQDRAGEQIIHEDREARIGELAYQRAEQRGFQPGHALDDWLWAERQIDAPSQGRDRDAH
jgi:hypothetical protein